MSLTQLERKIEKLSDEYSNTQFKNSSIHKDICKYMELDKSLELDEKKAYDDYLRAKSRYQNIKKEHKKIKNKLKIVSNQYDHNRNVLAFQRAEIVNLCNEESRQKQIKKNKELGVDLIFTSLHI
jgi:succinate dehydrogenase/fumarate reductase flavoprotein subunit